MADFAFAGVVIGAAGDDANLMYLGVLLGVLAVGIIGAVIARFRRRGMTRALFATALAQVVLAVDALMAGLGSPASGPWKLLALNGVFVVLFPGPARLFRTAARRRPCAEAR